MNTTTSTQFFAHSPTGDYEVIALKARTLLGAKRAATRIFSTAACGEIEIISRSDTGFGWDVLSRRVGHGKWSDA